MTVEERFFVFLIAAGGSAVITGLFGRANGWTGVLSSVLFWSGLGLAIASLLVLATALPEVVHNWRQDRLERRRT